MNIRAKDAKTTFLLARYAERVLAPMVQELADASATLHINCTFGSHNYSRPWHIDLKVHWKLDGMGLNKICLTSTEAIDRVTREFRTTVDRVLAELVESEQMAA